MLRSILVLSVMMLPASLNAQDTQLKKVASVEGVNEYRLENGARILLFPDESKPTVTVNMTVMVGSRHEGYGEAGMAHLLEHMVFKGTPTFKDIPAALKDHGASFNGTTNSDRTNYFETLPATDENLEFAIHLESDRLVNSFIKHEDLMSEFSVVRNEFERGENSPEGVLRQRVMAAAFEWHNYGKTTIGNRSDIERVPIDALRDFYRKYYQPDNVVMIITGRFKEAKALELVQKHLGSIPVPKRELKGTYTEEPAQDGERVVTLRRVGKVGSLTAAYHMPAASHEDWAPLSILASVLSEDKVGLLEKVLVETKIATRASARSGNSYDPGLFFFSVSPTEGNLDKARALMTETLDGLGGAKIESDAVERAKARYLRRIEDMLNDAGRVSSMLSSASSLGDWRLMFIQRDRIDAVTSEDVQRVARTYFYPHNRTLGIFRPSEEPKRLTIPAVASINNIVKDYKGGVAKMAGEAFDPSPANLDERIEHVNMDGIKVAMLQKKNRGETVNMTLTLRYGNEESLADKTTAAGMVSPMLMAGTKDMDRQALQARMTDLGVRISGGGRRGRRGGRGGGGRGGALSFSIQAKRSSLVPAVQLLGEIMRNPAFPQEDFDQMKSRSLMMMKRMQSEPQMLASNELSRALSQYPKGDPRYVPTSEERMEQIENVTLEDVVDVYKNQIGAVTGEVAIVGEFEPQEILAALSEVTQDWKTDVKFSSIDRKAPKGLTGSKKDIITPDKANAVFMAGLAFEMNDTDADVEALQLGNSILGGGALSSRLGNRIRQKEGLSYGVSSSVRIPSKGNAAQFMMNAITNPTNMDAVEKAAMEELTRFIEEGPTDQEVADAKTGWLERQKVSRASDGSIAGTASSNLYLDRTFDFISRREAKISKLTAADIKTAFQKHVKPDDLIVVRAGDMKQ